MGGDARRSGAEDRPAAADLYRNGRAGLRRDRGPGLSGTVELDLAFAGLTGAITSHLFVPSGAGEGPALVDPGPSTTLPELRAGLGRNGLDISELRWVLVTHAHLDHAGGVGHLVRENPDLVVVAHEDAVPHLADPERLVASTRRTFGVRLDELFGEVIPIPPERLHAWAPGAPSPVRGVRVIGTPGHLPHHVAFLDEGDGTFYAGDSLGIDLAPDAPVHPPTPPPGIDLAAWRATLARIRALAPARAAIHHSGVQEDPNRLLDGLEEALADLEARVRRGLREGPVGVQREREAFDAQARAWLAAVRPRKKVHTYFDIFRADNDFDGVLRWVEKG